MLVPLCGVGGSGTSLGCGCSVLGGVPGRDMSVMARDSVSDSDVQSTNDSLAGEGSVSATATSDSLHWHIGLGLVRNSSHSHSSYVSLGVCVFTRSTA